MNLTREQLRPVRHGLLLGALAVLYGFSLGVFFGAGEEWLREGQARDAEAHLDAYLALNPDAAQPREAAHAAMKRTLDASWRYWLRAHFHAGGIGAVAIGLGLLLSFLASPTSLKTLASVLLGIGALGYPAFWMLAGIRAPALGSTGLAKESLRWLAIPTAGSAIVGALLTLALVAASLLGRDASRGPGD